MPKSSRLFNVAHVAQELAVSCSTVNRRIARGEITPDFEVSGYNGDRLFTAETLNEIAALNSDR